MAGRGRWPQQSAVATIAIGYADGISRSFGNGKGHFLVNGHPAPTLGNICMDMCMLNVTGIPCQEGDEVVVFGPEWPLEAVAAMGNLIPYELLSGISARVKRVYRVE